MDSALLVKRGNIRIGDLVNTLPPGIELNPALDLDTVLIKMSDLDEESRKHKFLLNDRNLEKAQHGEEIEDLSRRVGRKSNEIQYNAAMPFPKAGQVDYKERRRRNLSEAQEKKRPKNIKTLIKNLGLKIQQD